MLKGSPASVGIGIGKAVIIKQQQVVAPKMIVTNKENEKNRFMRAAEYFCEQVMRASDAVGRTIGEDEATIIAAQSAIVSDPELWDEVFEIIDSESMCAEYAFDQVCEKYIHLFTSLEDELMRARSADFQDIKSRLLSIMLGIKTVELQNVPRGSVLVADDISPSQAVTLNPTKVSGIVTRMGTRFSHIALIARALRIPAVVAVEDVWDKVESGEKLIVDGDSGNVLISPSDEQLVRYKQYRRRKRVHQQKLLGYRDRETYTADGRRIGLSANLALLGNLSIVAEDNVDGIGLFRTEFLYMGRNSLPSEEEQFTAYRRVLQAMGGKPVVIRTLDVGGDKQVPALHFGKEENPIMGERAIRYCLNHEDLFKVQLTALLRASIYGNLMILLPMIATVSELRKAKVLIAEVKKELDIDGVPYNDDVQVGSMIETPAAAICADALAREVDFFSVGTSDLTQYTLAADRCNKAVAGMFNTMHPAVLRMIKCAIDGARKSDIPAWICGEAAADLRMIPLLVGLGAEGLSVSISSVLAVRELLSRVDYSFWRGQIDRVLELETAAEVYTFVKANLPQQASQ